METFIYTEMVEDFTGSQLLESIRKRPAMYIGCCTIRGFEPLFYQFFDDLNAGSNQKVAIHITFEANNWIKIAFEPSEMTLSRFLQSFQQNYAEDFRSYSLAIFIALSEAIQLSIQSNSILLTLSAQKGYITSSESMNCDGMPNVQIDFKIDSERFPKMIIDYEIMNQIFRQYALLNPYFRIISTNNITHNLQINIFEYPKGIDYQLDYEIAKQQYGEPYFRFECQTTIDDYKYQICLAYLDSDFFKTFITSYANNDELIHGGSLIDGVLAGLEDSIENIVKSQNKSIKVNCKTIKKNLILIASVRDNQWRFTFAGSIKGALIMPQMKKNIKQYFYTELMTHFEKHPEVVKKLITYFPLF